MATQYNSIIRLQTIDQCLRDKRKVYHLTGLIDRIAKRLRQYDKEVKVSERTVYDDLKFLKDTDGPFAAPIARNKDSGYHYTDPTYSIFQSQDDLGSVERLQAGIIALRQVSRLKGFEELKAILFRLEANYMIDQDAVVAPIVYLEEGLNLEGQSKIEEVKQYILDRVVMSISYQPFDREPSNRLVSPYFLKEYNNRWFLFGYQHAIHEGEYEGITNLALDRIVTIKASTLDYQTNDELIDPKEHFRQVIGVSVPDDDEEDITYRVYGRRRHYVATKKLHPSQRQVDSGDDYTTFRLSVIPNNELYSKLLSYGADLEVLEPQSVRETMKDLVVSMATRYAAVR